MMESHGASPLPPATAGLPSSEEESAETSATKEKKKKEPFNLWRIILILFFSSIAYVGWQTVSINRYGDVLANC